MNRIIALWTHPRSISTAFERVMMERGDMRVLHEPFSYLYYVHEQNGTVPQEYEDPEHPRSYPEIKAHLFSAARQTPVFFKDMCSHCHDYIIQDDDLLCRLTNTFLIRQPDRAIASYYAMNPNVTRDEIGYEQAYNVFNKLMGLTGSVPVVIDASDLEHEPEKTVKTYCDALGICFMPESLCWEPEHRQEWDIWKKWHADAAGSCGIQKDMETFEHTIDNSAVIKAYYDYHKPFYEALYAYRIR